MRFVISGPDKRFSYLKDMLSEENFEAEFASSASDFETADALIAKYPFDENTESNLPRLRPGARLFLLNGAPVPESLKERYVVNALLDDGDFVEYNAAVTAEGALFCAMRDTPFALKGEPCAVIGFGRIGRKLTELLVSVGARVTVFSRRESGRLSAMARGAQGAPVQKLTALLPDFRVIFVTSPERMLSMNELHCISSSAFVYDLSGPPYGADLDAAGEIGVYMKRESGLPGRYAPESAARGMLFAIKNRLGGDKL